MFNPLFSPTGQKVFFFNTVQKNVQVQDYY